MGFEKKIVAIILAAGRSSRMGAFKPLLDIGGRPALYRLLDSIRDAGISAAGVVAGSERESLDAAVRGYFASGSAARGNPAYGLSCRPDWDRIDRIQIDTVHNAQYARGMFSSVQAGIRYARGAGGVLLFPADVPLVSPDTIRTVLKAAAGSDAPFAVPVYQGKNGHPLFIPSGYFDEILTYDGEGGLKGVRSRYDEGLLRVPVTDRGCVMDMDTPEDYKRLIQLFYDSSLRIILIRHGQPAQQRGKIFLGQTDIPLSDMGREEAKAAADTLIRLGVRPGRIYASDLARARETAEIIAARIGGVHVEEDKLFREMDMGSWDGEFIDEVKEKFPEEYAKRGEDIKSYRIPGGENFYDLRGRVSREFFRIWTGEFLPGARGGCSRDLVIVSHLGVIHSLATELLQDDHIPRDYPTGSVTVMDVPDWLRPEESK